MVLSQAVSFPYNATLVSFSFERINLGRPLILRELASWRIKDSLNRLKVLTVTVVINSVPLEDVYVEREVLVPAFNFEGIITALTANNNDTLEITITEKAWHFTRRLYKIDDSLKEYNLVLVDPASLPNFLQLILNSANKDMPGIEGSVLIPDLISLFRLDDNALDSKSINDGTWIGTETYGDSQYSEGKAAVFAGASRIQISNEATFDFDYSDKFSVAFWFFSTFSDNEIMVAKRDNRTTAAAGWFVGFRNSDDSIRFETSNGTTEYTAIGGTSFHGDDKWHYCVVTCDGTSNQNGLQIYIDGALNATGADLATTGSMLNNLPPTIGAGDEPNQFFTGSIDDVRFYNRKLTDAEILTLAAAPRSGVDNIVTLLQWILGEDIPATSDFDFDVKWKSYYEILRLVAKNSANDVWFEGRKVFFGIKGKQIALDTDDRIYKKLQTKLDLDVYGNIVHVVGAKVGGVNVHATASNTVTDLQFNYERVVSNNNLKDQGAVDGVIDRILGEFDTIAPDVSINITQSTIHKYDMKSGDVIKIISNTQTQKVKGFFRIIDVVIGSTSSSIKLQFSKTGQFLPRISDSLDILSAALIKIHDLELNS